MSLKDYLWWRSDGEDEKNTAFMPVCTDGNRVLGYLDEPDADELRLVWVKDTTFDRVDGDEIDEVAPLVIEH